MTRVLAIDLGGTSLRAAVVETDGEIRHLAKVPLAAVADGTARAEIDPEIWWAALAEAVNALAGDDGLAGIGAVAVCAFTRTQVFLDKDNRVVRPALTFRDARAADRVDRLMGDDAIRAHPAARQLNAYHPLARLLWLQENEPASWDRVATVVEPKDFLNFRLTGALVSDGVSQHWLRDSYDAASGRTLAALAGVGRVVLPALLPPQAIVGRVRSGLPGALARLAGVPVVCGSTDTWVAVAGLGAMSAGKAYNISGTSEVVGLMSAAPAEADGLVTMAWGDGLWQIGGPGQNGAELLTWARERFAPGARLDDVPRDPAPPPLIFLPFLHGERTPFWDPDLRAALLGLGPEHGPGDILRAVMEGLAFLNRLVLERAEAAAGRQAVELRFGGGGARNAAWAQIKADVLDRPVVVRQAEEIGLIGAAALARIGIGEHAGLDEADAALAIAETRYAPDRGRRALYDERYAIFRQAHAAMRPISHALAAHRGAHPDRRR